MIQIIDDVGPQAPFPVGTVVKVTTNKKLLHEHGLDDRRDDPNEEFIVQAVEHHMVRWIHILDDKDDLWYPPEVLIKVKDAD